MYFHIFCSSDTFLMSILFVDYLIHCSELFLILKMSYSASQWSLQGKTASNESPKLIRNNGRLIFLSTNVKLCHLDTLRCVDKVCSVKSLETFFLHFRPHSHKGLSCLGLFFKRPRKPSGDEGQQAIVGQTQVLIWLCTRARAIRNPGTAV